MGSKGLDDQTSGEFDNLRVFAEPIEGFMVAVGIVPADFLETVFLSSRKRGRVLGPLTANRDGIEF